MISVGIAEAIMSSKAIKYQYLNADGPELMRNSQENTRLKAKMRDRQFSPIWQNGNQIQPK